MTCNCPVLEPMVSMVEFYFRQGKIEQDKVPIEHSDYQLHQVGTGGETFLEKVMRSRGACRVLASVRRQLLTYIPHLFDAHISLQKENSYLVDEGFVGCLGSVFGVTQNSVFTQQMLEIAPPRLGEEVGVFE